MNLLRVWGGGIYESDDFYDICDELGILVWQDFLFACAAYSEEEPLCGEVEAEAREAVTRLSRHASLVVWNGNNENIWGYVEWGWRVPLAGRTWGDGLLLRPASRDRGRARPADAVLARQPVLVRPSTSTRTTSATAPCTSGTSGTSVDYTTYREVQAAVRLGVRVPGTAGLVDADVGGA